MAVGKDSLQGAQISLNPINTHSICLVNSGQNVEMFKTSWGANRGVFIEFSLLKSMCIYNFIL